MPETLWNLTRRTHFPIEASLDSCGGIYGFDIAKKEALHSLELCLESGGYNEPDPSLLLEASNG